MTDITTWQSLIGYALEGEKESWNDVIDHTFTSLFPDKLTERFDRLASGGVPFTLWTHNRVYFPTEYDGSVSVASVPRHPCDEATRHI